MLFVFVCVYWCSTRLDYISNMAGILKRQELLILHKHLSSSLVLGGSVLLLFLASMFYYVFVFCLSSFCTLRAQYVASVSGLSFLDCPFGFLAFNLNHL